MAKAPTDIRSLARTHTDTALKVLAGIMAEPKAPQAARVAAANSLLDRGWGKATQLFGGDAEAGPIQVQTLTDDQRAQAVTALLAKVTNGHAMNDTALDD